ncbi:hypothetical protein CE143_02645 [Photorhabdus luminescens]|nr:DUF1837 domain-containing protein [Photorhabdus akhurstii]UJD73988.1 hypothetical protein CE143_02645 [Photorhabdus luminescens]
MSHLTGNVWWDVVRSNILKFDHLLTNTESLFNQMFWFEQKISSPRAASHRGVAIKYVDIKELRGGFIRELKSTATNWVYSKSKYKEIFDDELSKRNDDYQNTAAYIAEVADLKFRKGHPQGQYGELLLFNFIQHFFKAPPLLRKMSITTNPGIERHGADAIHFREDSHQQLFILGESKCYESKYSFNKALEASVKSIIDSFENIDNELVLYQHDDFIEPELQKIAKSLKDGKILNPRFELVCLIAYEENQKIDAPSQEEILEKIKECLTSRWNNVDENLYSLRRDVVIDRIHYIVFPTWSLDQLLAKF